MLTCAERAAACETRSAATLTQHTSLVPMLSSRGLKQRERRRRGQQVAVGIQDTDLIRRRVARDEQYALSPQLGPASAYVFSFTFPSPDSPARTKST